MSEPHLWLMGREPNGISDCKGGWQIASAFATLENAMAKGQYLVPASTWAYADNVSTMNASMPSAETLGADGWLGFSAENTAEVAEKSVDALKAALATESTVVYSVPVFKDVGWACWDDALNCLAFWKEQQIKAPDPAPANDCRCECEKDAAGNPVDAWCTECAGEPHCVRGYHAILIVGYDDAGDGSFELLNSWGSDWGDDGFARITYDFIGRHGRGGHYATDLAVRCAPRCEDSVCGDDGCGGSCGECADGELCSLGACQTPIIGVPIGVNDFLGPDDIDALVQGGMTIHPGDDPPNITGAYDADDLEITYDDSSGSLNIAPYSWRFADQSSGAVTVDYASGSGTDAGDGLGAYISGKEGCFTVFVDSRGTSNGCQYVSPMLVSGCLDAAGIRDFQLALLMRRKQGSNCDKIIPEGHRRIVTEMDGMADVNR